MNVGKLRAILTDAPDDAEVIVTAPGDPSVGIFPFESSVLSASLVDAFEYDQYRSDDTTARVLELVIES